MLKRSFRRVNVKDGTCILMKSGFFNGIIENISLGGVFVSSDIPLNVMDKVHMSMFLPSNAGGIEIDTDIVATRVENRGIAFKYDCLDRENSWTLQSYINGLA
jgi:hypothetical protein